MTHSANLLEHGQFQFISLNKISSKEGEELHN